MPQVLARVARIPRLSRFGWLMGLYAENFQRITRLFEPADLAPGDYDSAIGDGLDLRLSVIAQHPYTTELRMTYLLRDPVTGEPDPSAFLRLYRDARQVEATHCYIGRRWQDVIGMYPPPSEVLDHRMRMNTFLGKWLQYLAEGGHGVATLRSAGVENAFTFSGTALTSSLQDARTAHEPRTEGLLAFPPTRPNAHEEAP